MRRKQHRGVVVAAVWSLGVALAGCGKAAPGRIDPGPGGAGPGDAGQGGTGGSGASELDPYRTDAAWTRDPSQPDPYDRTGQGGADRTDAGPPDVDGRDPVERLLALAEGVTVLRFTTVAPNPSHDPSVNVTVTDPSAARDLCAATVTLPVMPRGTYNCFADWGIAYQLSFFDTDPATGAAPVIVATLHPGGCQTATITGGADTLSGRWTVGAGGYWETLAAALGVPRETLIK